MKGWPPSHVAPGQTLCQAVTSKLVAFSGQDPGSYCVKKLTRAHTFPPHGGPCPGEQSQHSPDAGAMGEAGTLVHGEDNSPPRKWGHL